MDKDSKKAAIQFGVILCVVGAILCLVKLAAAVSNSLTAGVLMVLLFVYVVRGRKTRRR